MHPNGRNDPTEDMQVCFASQPFSASDFSHDMDGHELDLDEICPGASV